MLTNTKILAVFVLACTFPLCAFAASDSIASPVNQVFQFMESGTCSAWADGSTSKASVYLWIPEKCKRLRGLLILCNNVPEHMLVGHPAIREVCAANDLGIVWGSPSFMNFHKGADMSKESKTVVTFLQQLLDGLAQKSGYAEVATVPWLPMGESGHLIMVDDLIREQPQRCIAGIYIKNNHWHPENREVPTLVAYGTAQEWSQDKSDIRTKWNNIGPAYEGVLNQRKENPDWPLSYVIDGTSGHFDCSQRLAAYFAHYIDLVSKARLSDDGSPNLKPIKMKTGYLADLPVPGHEDQLVLPHMEAAADKRNLPWFFDRAGALEAQAIAHINWQAETQLPAFCDAGGAVFPFNFNGITLIPINKKPDPLPAGLPTPVLETEEDGITFTLKALMLDAIPADFVEAGQPLPKAPGTPVIEWLCGCVEPLGNDKFRMAIDRTWPSPIYIAARQQGTDSIRGIVEPGQITRDKHEEGTPQKITFEAIPDVKAGTVSIPLLAHADSGMLVRFFVVAGPAVIEDNQLVFTGIPPRSKFPIEVTVGAWQWGKGTEPKVKTAEIVRQSFQIIKPIAPAI